MLKPVFRFLNWSFEGVNRFFVLTFNVLDNRNGHSRYYLPMAQVEDYNVEIDGFFFFFDKPIKNDIKTYKNIRKITSGQEDDYITGCLLDYNYFKKHYKMTAIDLRKKQALAADWKAIQQINFTGNLEGGNDRSLFFIIEKVKKPILSFSQETV